jgi:hypothetical protein
MPLRRATEKRQTRGRLHIPAEVIFSGHGFRPFRMYVGCWIRSKEVYPRGFAVQSVGENAQSALTYGLYLVFA